MLTILYRHFAFCIHVCELSIVESTHLSPIADGRIVLRLQQPQDQFCLFRPWRGGLWGHSSIRRVRALPKHHCLERWLKPRRSWRCCGAGYPCQWFILCYSGGPAGSWWAAGSWRAGAVWVGQQYTGSFLPRLRIWNLAIPTRKTFAKGFATSSIQHDWRNYASHTNCSAYTHAVPLAPWHANKRIDLTVQ